MNPKKKKDKKEGVENSKIRLLLSYKANGFLRLLKRGA